jgi:hypothetical protein
MAVASTIVNYDRKTVNVNNSQTISIIAGENLSASAGMAVKVDTGEIKTVAGQGERAFGILIQGCADTEMASVAISGRVQAVAGAAIVQGALVTPQADGQLETATTGDYPLGIALEAAAGAGSLFYMLITHAAIIA